MVLELLAHGLFRCGTAYGEAAAVLAREMFIYVINLLRKPTDLYVKNPLKILTISLFRK